MILSACQVVSWAPDSSVKYGRKIVSMGSETVITERNYDSLLYRQAVLSYPDYLSININETYFYVAQSLLHILTDACSIS
jgi:hypothetical protein